MNPAWSVILLTTLLGVGQGLFLAVWGVEFAVSGGGVVPAGFYVAGSLLSLLFLAGGLVASIFHLGHPERGWRAAAMWRTSWLSRAYRATARFSHAGSNASALAAANAELDRAVGMLTALQVVG